MFGSSSDLNHMPRFSGSSSGTTKYQVKNCTINGTLRNSSTYSVPSIERKRLGTVRKIPNSEPTRNAIIQAVIDNATVT
ncbi:hypothetical protein D3C72_1976700 [compost metagenome]